MCRLEQNQPFCAFISCRHAAHRYGKPLDTAEFASDLELADPVQPQAGLAFCSLFAVECFPAQLPGVPAILISSDGILLCCGWLLPLGLLTFCIHLTADLRHLLSLIVLCQCIIHMRTHLRNLMIRRDTHSTVADVPVHASIHT